MKDYSALCNINMFPGLENHFKNSFMCSFSLTTGTLNKWAQKCVFRVKI